MTRAAVAGEGADADQGPGLGPAATLGGGPVHAPGERCPPARRAAASGERRARRAVGSSPPGSAPPRAGRRGWRATARSRSPSARGPPSLRANLSALRAPRRVVPLTPRASREALEQHLGEEVVRGLVGLGDQRSPAWASGRLPSGRRRSALAGQVGAAGASLDADPQLSQPALRASAPRPARGSWRSGRPRSPSCRRGPRAGPAPRMHRPRWSAPRGGGRRPSRRRGCRR